MAKDNSKKLRRPNGPTIKPPTHFGSQTEGVSPDDAKRIIEARQVSSNIVRPETDENKTGGNQ